MTKAETTKSHVCKCGKSFIRDDLLRRHIRRKKAVKRHVCEFPGCAYKSSRSENLVTHKRIHNGEKPFSCTGCGFKSATLSHLGRHMKTHSGQKQFSCTFQGCTYECNRRENLVTHMRFHFGTKPFPCNFPECDFKGTTSSHLKRHQETHTIKGQIRRKKQENRVSTLLKEWGYTADPEVTINASRNKCVEDTQRYYSRLDFTIINCVNAILIIEVDEDQHTWYNLSCEFSRMSDIRTSLLTAGYELPIFWIRYNPNGKYHIGTRRVNKYRPIRESSLRSKLEELCSPDFVPINQVNIHYMYYDLISEETGPEIMVDNDFPEYLQECISWCI